MQGNDPRYRLKGAGTPANAFAGWLGRVVAAAAGIVLVMAGLMLSLIAFAAVAAAGLLGALYLWWRTRDLRRRMREMQDIPPGGRVIEGEATRDPSR
jgi:Flp pilus assembly protein TadB